MEDDLIGKSLGQFEIIEEIGRGGMASVYRARQTSINRIVAVKVLPRSLLHDPSFYERFTREVELVAHLEHPHILPIHDYGEVDGTPYIAMRYLAGGSMAQWIRRGLPPLDKIAKPIEQVASALDYAHQQGVIHRDIKPGNILLDENGNAYLSDFGIARVLGSNLTGSALIGTPAYMSPEQANGAPLDARSDIYSLGVVLFELVTGREPFEAETPVALLLKHINEPMPSARALRPELPISAERVIAKATAKRPEDRYPSASDLARAFTAALGTHDPTPAVEVEDEAGKPTLFDPDSLLKRIPTTPPATPPAPLPAASATDTRAAETHTADVVPKAIESAQRQDVPSVPQPPAERPAKPSRRLPMILAGAGVIAVLAVVISLGASALNNSASVTPTALLTQPPGNTPSQAAAVASDLPTEASTAVATQAGTTTPTVSLAQTENSPATAQSSIIPPAGLGSEQGQIAFVSNRDGNNEIYVMNLDGTGLKNLTNNPANDERPNWSPDGMKIAFASYRDDSSTPALYIMDADGGNVRRLVEGTFTNGYDPAWSPDGTQIAMTSYDQGNAEVFVANVDGTHLQRVTNRPEGDGRPSWSPDGKHIAFESSVDNDTNHEIFVIDADGQNLKRLTDSPDQDSYPAWSPRGSEIVFQSTSANGNPMIYTVNADTGARQLIGSGDVNDDGYFPAWSADGSQILFASYRGGAGLDIYVIDADGSHVTRITDDPGDDISAVWRP